MRITELGTDGTPCEHPAPERMAYMVLPTNAISATPQTSEPRAALVWLDGRLSAIVVRLPFASMREMREPTALPWYGPTGGTTKHFGLSGGSWVPPRPPSAT